MDFKEIKKLAKELNCKTTDLIVLAPQRDPFYIGTKRQTALAQWFANIWRDFNYSDGVHLRRIHYRMISQKLPIKFPNGTPYLNTKSCWQDLCTASLYARYSHFVDPQLFDDRRNNKPLIYFEPSSEKPSIEVEEGYNLLEDFQLPSLPSLPQFTIYNFEQSQRYHLEIWCEKSTMNDIFLPLCQSKEANLITGVGEMSFTQVVWLFSRLKGYQKPCRILYVSDFDPAGQSMPVAVSRKIEKEVRDDTKNLYDVRLIPLILTKQQCVEYQLPRTPIKEKELRKQAFEDRHGEGATELDALEALFPGDLKKILADAINKYRDSKLNLKVHEAKDKLEIDLNNILDGVYAGYADEVANIESEYKQLAAEFEGEFSDIFSRIEKIWHAVRKDLIENTPDIELYPLPEPDTGNEIDDGLYNSNRTYLEQLKCYKAFQGKL